MVERERSLRAKIDRRGAMLEAATEAFLAHGFEGTSLDRVIQRSGGSRSTLYEAFGNKEGLFAATVEAALDGLVERLATLETAEGPPETVLAKVGSDFVASLCSQRHVALFRVVAGEAHRFPELGGRLYQRGPQRSYDIVARYLRRQTEAGALSVSDPEAIAPALVEMIKGDRHTKAMFNPDAAPDRAQIEAGVTAAVRQFLRGAAPRQTE